MRLINRSAFAALVAVLAISLVGAASASAAGCPGTEKGVVLCSGGLTQEGAFAFSGSKRAATSSKFEVEGYAPECTGEKSRGQLNGTKSTLSATSTIIEFTGCVVAASPSKCEVKTPGVSAGTIIFDGGEGTGSGSGLKGTLTNTGEITYAAAKGSPISEITYKSKTGQTCALAGKYAVAGTQVCKLPGSTAEALAHYVDCEGKGTLTFAELPMRLIYEEELGLSPAKDFSLQQP